MVVTQQGSLRGFTDDEEQHEVEGRDFREGPFPRDAEDEENHQVGRGTAQDNVHETPSFRAGKRFQG
ncbi:hypothetical protein D3C83_239010 [compost metagenome]